MTDMPRLKARLLKWRDAHKSYASCHPQPAAYRLARGMYGMGGKPGDKVRWAEKPESFGFRVVGNAGDIVRLEHNRLVC